MKTRVAGVKYYKNNFIGLLVENDDYYMSKSEILEDYYEDDRIYEYDIYDGTAELVPEPDNKYDSNAIAVVVDGCKIGHVPAELCAKVSKLIDDEHVFDVSIMGGPYKEVVSDDDGNLQIERGSLNFTATLTISEKQSKKQSTDHVEVQSEPAAVLPDVPQKPSGAARVFNYIMMALSIILALMGLLLLLVMPITGLAVIVGGILGFLYFKKRNK